MPMKVRYAAVNGRLVEEDQSEAVQHDANVNVDNVRRAITSAFGLDDSDRSGVDVEERLDDLDACFEQYQPSILAELMLALLHSLEEVDGPAGDAFRDLIVTLSGSYFGEEIQDWPSSLQLRQLTRPQREAIQSWLLAVAGTPLASASQILEDLVESWEWLGL